MRSIGIIVALLTAAIMFGGNSASASQQGKRIAALTTLTTHPWVGMWAKTFVASAQAAGMKVTNYTTPFDAALQSQQVDDAIAQKFDLIIVIVVNPQAIRPALIRAKQAGIPVMIAVGPLPDEDKDLYLSHVGTNQTELGEYAAKNLVDALAKEGKTKAKVAAITGTASQLQVQQRVAGFRSVLAKHPGITLAAVEDGQWNTARSEKIASDLLVRYAGSGGLDGIFAMADNQATGVIQAIQAAGMKVGLADKGIVVVASNCTKDGIIHIKNGTQYSTGTQLPSLEAKTTAEKIAAHFNGQKLQKDEYIPLDSITTANVDKFAAACSY